MNRFIPTNCLRAYLKRLIIFLILIVLLPPLLIKPENWSTTDISTLSDESSCNKQMPSLNKSDAQCAIYNFTPIDPDVNHTSLPVYDFFIFNDEFDSLEIHLFELYNYVTFFLIAESRTTLTGKAKPLHLKENWAKFAKYHDKIRRIEVELIKNVRNAWSNEYRMRDQGLRLALSTISDKKYLLLASDVDEIPKARFMNALVHCQLPNPFKSLVLNCDFYYYSYEFRTKKLLHYGTTVTLVRPTELGIPSGSLLRSRRHYLRFMPSTCYHCTWCFDQLELVRLKMSSYSHTEHNRIQFRRRNHILNRYRSGKDLFDRPGLQYIYIKNNTEYPALVKLQAERFQYMTKRTNLTNVGFIDA